MQRRSFVKNIFGSVIGFAVFPTAIKEFAESVPVEVPVKYVYYVDTSAFRVGDIIMLPSGKQYAIIYSMFGDLGARSLEHGLYDITLKPRQDFQKPDNVFRMAACVSEFKTTEINK